MIPPHRINDVIYFNPADQDYPISFNVLEEVPREFRPLVASGLIGVFQKLWADSWGPRLEYILRNALLALLETPGSTLLGVMRILIDKKYRIRVSNNITDPVVKAFWTEEFPKWNERVLQEVISPIQNKVGQFLTSPLIRNIVGQTKSAFDVREAMDNKKILILNLAKGRMGEDNSALIGAMLITKIQLAAMGRVDMEEEEREDFYLYVDEFQNFSTESFANILSEARKYRLNLILANQYITQIDEIVRDAIFGNVGTIVSFRVGAVDAEYLEKEFEPIFTMNDIVNLPKYNIYLKLMIDGIAGDAFSASTLPPIERRYADSTEKVIASSRERYAQDRVAVEEKIARWSGMLVETVQDTESKKTIPLSKKITSKTPTKKVETREKQNEDNEIENQKAMYDAVCASCDLEIQVPFEPDGARPVFCKECFKDHQRVLAKSKKNDISIKKQDSKPKKEEKKPQKERVVESDPVITDDSPAMSLSQLKHVAPKKFKQTSGKKPKIDSTSVKEMIKKTQAGDK
jgi:CxxC-x17-CxxC domain-containing protein